MDESNLDHCKLYLHQMASETVWACDVDPDTFDAWAKAGLERLKNAIASVESHYPEEVQREET